MKVYILTGCELGLMEDVKASDALDDVLNSGTPYPSFDAAVAALRAERELENADLTGDDRLPEPNWVWTEEIVGSGRLLRSWSAVDGNDPDDDYAARFMIREYELSEVLVDRPRLIVTSPDDDEQFHWFSVGWDGDENLMLIAQRAIAKGVDVPDCIILLEEAGFKVIREVG